MKDLSYHFANIEAERCLVSDKLHLAESQPGTTFEEVRVLRRQLEHLDHKLLWRKIWKA